MSSVDGEDREKMNSKRKYSEGALCENKKLKNTDNNLNQLSYFECLPDHILIDICNKLASHDLRSLFLVSKT